MGIYIKGMEMPESCWDCYFQDCGNCRLNAYKVVDKCIIEGRIDDDCPLVPVQPHGRLIDADALCDLLTRLADNEYSLSVFASWIKNHDEVFPTIIPADSAKHSNKDDVIDRSLEGIRP